MEDGPAFRAAEVTGTSIRWRILKGQRNISSKRDTRGYRDFDPMEDTESHPHLLRARSCRTVTGTSIRWRILKVVALGVLLPVLAVTGTSIRWRILKDGARFVGVDFVDQLQGLRSDGGY